MIDVEAQPRRASLPRVARTYLIVSVVAYLVAVLVPSYSPVGDSQAWTGFDCLRHGWIAKFPWLTNPALLWTWFSLGKNERRSLFMAVATLALSLTMFVYDPVISHYWVGSLLWYASILLALLGSLSVRSWGQS